jgi:hypothetical protein
VHFQNGCVWRERAAQCKTTAAQHCLRCWMLSFIP